MRFLLVLSIAVVCLSVACRAIDLNDYDQEFEKFRYRYNKTYSDYVEYEHRRRIFHENAKLIKEHNAKARSWFLDINEYADLTWTEFRSQKLGYKRTARKAPTNVVDLTHVVTAPNSVDWRKKGVVTTVKNQGQCGSCWAFSTTGSVESANAIKHGKLISLSEQELMDCSVPEGNQGCNGGLMDDAFEFIIKNKGICSEKSYPYEGTDGTCQACKNVETIHRFVDVSSNNEKALKAAAALQPISVAVEADQLGWQFYSGGVFDGTCGTNLDHGVLVVGYGTQAGQDYWIVKNSWGAAWGMEGYILLARNIASPQGQCGIAMQPSYPVA